MTLQTCSTVRRVLSCRDIVNRPNRCCPGFWCFAKKGNSLGCFLERRWRAEGSKEKAGASNNGVFSRLCMDKPVPFQFFYTDRPICSAKLVISHMGCLSTTFKARALSLIHAPNWHHFHPIIGLMVEKQKLWKGGFFGDKGNLRGQLCINQTYRGFLVITNKNNINK